MEWYEYFAVKDGDIVVDLGAGIGKPMMFFSRKVGSSGLVIAIEPIIENYRKIIQLIVNHKLSNVVPLMVAMSNRTNRSTINLSKHYDGHSLYWKNIYAGKRITTTITWDDLVDICNIKHVDLMKMNIEGGETNVLLGMGKALPDKIILTEHLRYEKEPERVLRNLVFLLETKKYEIVKREKCFIYAKRND